MKPVTYSAPNDHPVTLLPRWVNACARDGAPDSVTFASGAALAMLDLAMRSPADTLPVALLRDRLALKAAVRCLAFEGRNEGEADIRDAICLTRGTDALGPAGDMFARWRQMARINLRASNWAERLQRCLPAPMSGDDLLPAQSGAPMAQTAETLETVLHRFPRQEAAALMLADIVLARALGWGAPVPLLAAHIARRDIRAIATGEGDALRAIHTAIIAGSDTALRMALDLQRRAAHLAAISPKLRAKGAHEALKLFLSHDAISPSGMLSPVIGTSRVSMTDRAARRLCDRLVALGAVREMTGRPTFRLYGL